MAGYSGTPLPQKLGIKPGSRLGLFDAPADFATTLGALPEGVTQATRSGAALDVAVFFTTSRGALDKRFATYARAASRTDDSAPRSFDASLSDLSLARPSHFTR